MPSLCSVWYRSRSQQGNLKAWPSCCTWFRSMVASCASSTVRPVFSVTQSDCDGALVAVIAQKHTPTRDITVGDVFQDRRQPGHQDAAPVGLPTPHHPPHSSQPVPPGVPFDDSPLSPNATSSCSPIFEGSQQRPFRAA